MKTKHMFLMLFMCMCFYGYGQSSMTLSASDTINSLQFKSTAGTSRTAVFNLLKPLIVSEATQKYAATPAPILTSRTEMIFLLGTPDFTITSDVFGYYLNSIGGPCVVVFGVNASDQVQYCSTYDCN